MLPHVGTDFPCVLGLTLRVRGSEVPAFVFPVRTRRRFLTMSIGFVFLVAGALGLVFIGADDRVERFLRVLSAVAILVGGFYLLRSWLGLVGPGWQVGFTWWSVVLGSPFGIVEIPWQGIRSVDLSYRWWAILDRWPTYQCRIRALPHSVRASGLRRLYPRRTNHFLPDIVADLPPELICAMIRYYLDHPDERWSIGTREGLVELDSAAREALEE
jgi:hypothetical protein